MNIGNMLWWIDRMAIEAVKQYRKWREQKSPMDQEEEWDRLMGRLGEITEAINQIGGSKHATEENRAKIERTVEWLNSHMEQHKIRINMRG